MSIDRVGEAELDRLDAAVFEQRRLSHMLRQRGVEIEALRNERERLAAKERAAREREKDLRGELRKLEGSIASATSERERLEAELKQVGYEARRAERRVAEVESDAAEGSERARVRLDALGAKVASLEEERQRLRDEHAKAKEERDRLQQELAKGGQERERLETELGQARYEARRAERRIAKVERDAAGANKRNRLQVDALAAELRENKIARDAALKERQKALQSRDEATVAAKESMHELEETARGLGLAEREVELLVDRERETEALLASSDRMLEGVAEHLLRTRASRSWRWGHALAQAFRTLTFRRRSGRSALDTALGRLEAEGRVQAGAG